MSILLDENTKVIVQGITGRDGSFHTKTMVKDGSNIVAGVTPGKGGTSMDGIPVYNTVSECMKNHEVDASAIFVPAAFAAGAVREALNAAIPLVVCITEGVPVQEMTGLYHLARRQGVVLIGPNCPGLISPGKSKIGIMPLKIHKEGEIAVISRSGTLTYEVVNELTLAGMGQSTCIGIGGDPIVGSGFVDLLTLFEEDDETRGVVLIGEIGGEAEEEAARFIQEKMSKPVVAFISGRSAPKGKRMGHAGAIISGGKGTAEAKVAAFQAAGVDVADKPDEIPALLRKKID